MIKRINKSLAYKSLKEGISSVRKSLICFIHKNGFQFERKWSH